MCCPPRSDRFRALVALAVFSLLGLACGGSESPGAGEPQPQSPSQSQPQPTSATAPDAQPASAYSSPEATWTTMVQAAAAHDHDGFLACFADGPDRESMAGDLEKKPERFWSQLEGVLRGPHKLTVGAQSGDTVRASVESPQAEGGGIGSLTFVRVDQNWKIRSW